MKSESWPLVTTVMPCYNSARYLQATLNSVQAQTYQNWELIAVDDCSSDSTREILHLAAKEDSRIRVIEHKNRAGWPGITRNTGIASARGELLQFIDHDDLYLPERTESLLNVLRQNDSWCVAFCNMHYINGAGKVGQPYLVHFLEDAHTYLTQLADNIFSVDARFFIFQSLRYSALQTNTCLIDRRKLKAFDIRFTSESVLAEDKDYWVRLGMHGGIAYLNRSLARYRLHDTNLTKQPLLVLSGVAKFTSLNRLRISPLATPNEVIALRWHEAKVYANLGWGLRLAKQHAKAFSAYSHALRLQPSSAHLLAAAKAWLPACTTSPG